MRTPKAANYFTQKYDIPYLAIESEIPRFPSSTSRYRNGGGVLIYGEMHEDDIATKCEAVEEDEEEKEEEVATSVISLSLFSP